MWQNDRCSFIWKWNNKIQKDHPQYVRDLFKSWDIILRQYERVWHDTGDLPYVYDERAQVGLLAVASREMNGCPVTEFYTERTGNKSGYGYGDLAIVWPRREFETWAEISHIRLSWHDAMNNMYDRVYKRFWHAKNGVKSLKFRSRSLAIMFIRFYNFNEDDYKPKVFNQKINELKNVLNKTTQRLKADFFAVHLCEPRLVKNSKSKDCPGIAVIGQLYKKP